MLKPKTVRSLIALLLCFCCILPVSSRANQIVSSDELHQDLREASLQKQQNLATLEALISWAPAQSMLQSRGIDSQEVIDALPRLSDEELAQLASQARTAQMNFAAGLSDRELINVLLIVLLVVAIIVVVAAVAD